MTTETNYTKLDVRTNLETLKQFIPSNELSMVREAMRGEEGQHFINKLVEIAEVVKTTPVTYGQDGMGDNAIAYLHYFRGGMDWYITEKDSEDEQLQAFGIVNMGHGFEMGYISIVELLNSQIELDLHFTPKTLGEIKNA